jgi:membrane peptidoglycan carboxypeptidase
MKTIAVLALVVGLGLGTTSAFALASKQPGHPKRGATSATGPTGATGAAPKGKAYGWYCRDQSRKHVQGQKGTPFSQCVTAMAKLKSGKTNSPAAACANLSKAHTPGQPGTPFSRCVAAGTKLLKDQHKP